MAMARWFKRDYMRWVDPVKCPMCGGSTTSTGSAEPNSQERMDGGGRVEIHQCEDEGCRAGRRFARYGSVKTLLRTREGRCGTFCHAM
jgi:peptide-N4-(N-acetyl-beta-glucosaminyl)asparagine amidase